MEALGSAASVIAAIQITGSVIKICWGYIGEAKDAKEDIQYLLKVVEDFQVVLEKLHCLLDGQNGQKLPVTQVLGHTISECQWELEKLGEKLDAGRPKEKNDENRKRGKIIRYFGWRSIKWPLERKEVEKIVSRIERYKRVFLAALQLDLVDVTVRIDQKVDLAKLLTVDEAMFGSYMDQHEDECLEQTRTELLHDILAWSADINSKYIFWLNGVAGTGKSTIARTVARLLKEKNRLGASFFFKRGEADRGNATRFFTTIVKQLVGQFPPLGPLVAKAVEDDPAIGKKSLREQFRALLLDPLSQLQRGDRGFPLLVIIIDALDECEEEQDIRTILRLLPSIKSSGPVHLRLFITSRPELPIRLGFKQVHVDDYQDTVLHEIPEDIIAHDLMVYFKSRLCAIREERTLPDGWPGEDITRTLVRMAIPLFIFAATICRFIGDLKWGPEERLEIILQTELKNDMTPLELTYAPILNNLLSGASPCDSEQLVDEFQKIVGVIIILASPLSILSLGQLLEIPTQKIERRLEFFHSVLNVPRNANQPVRLFHLSFRDFLLDPRRKNNVFWVNGKERHGKVAVQCLTLMRRLLRKNICNLPHVGALRDEIDDQTRHDCLPMELQYACRYWIYHLQEGDIRDEEGVQSFLTEHLLHWLEALSILGHVSESISGLGFLQSITEDDSELSAFLHDAKRFVLNCISVIDSAPLQLYCSALVFAPEKSRIRHMFDDNIPSWMRRLPKVDTSWSAAQQTLEPHDRHVFAVAFSPNGKLVASASQKTIKLWDATSGLGQQTFEIHNDRGGTGKGVAFSPDGKLVTSTSYKIVILWDTISGLIQQTFEGHNNWVNTVAFSPNGKLIVSASDETIIIWDVTSGLTRQTLKGHDSYVNKVAFSPDGKLIASATHETIKLWDASSGLIQHTIEGHYNMKGLAFSPDSKLVASGFGKAVELRDATSGLIWQTLEGHNDPVATVAFSPDGKFIASASDHGIIKLWDATSGLILRTLEGHIDGVTAVAFSPNSKLIASASLDYTIKLWNTTSLLIQQTFERHNDEVCAVTFSPNDKIVASASFDDTIKLWDATSSLVPHTFEGRCNPITGVQIAAFSPDSKLIASVSPGSTTIKLWDITSGLVQQTFEGHDGSVNSMAFSPNGKLFALTSDKTVTLWDTTSGLIYQPFGIYNDPINMVEGVAFSPNTKLIALASSDKKVKLWDITLGLIQQTLRGHTKTVNAVAFSLDGKLLASASYDGTVKLWDITSGLVQLTLDFDTIISSIRFSPQTGFLETDRGIFDIGSVDTDYGPQHEYRSGISLERRWVNLKGIPSLWLPPEYRASSSCIASSTGTLVLGHPSGRVSFMAFDLDCL
ncbi:hypothetical protein DTO212C5_3642 [Paecilomyces variotii]|nr:hypothetical protein DTO212C5_3642 [Paecilomyces variotii]